MDGFTGAGSASADELPDATAVMDPFHVVHLAGDALDECRRRTGQELHHRRGRAADPSTMPAVYSTPDPACSPHANNSGSSTCSPAIAASPSRSHGASTRTLPGAYRDPNKIHGKALMQTDIDRLSDARVPRSLTEIITLGRTLKRRSRDILTYFDHPHTTGAPTETINGRLKHLRGSALGFRNLTHYITRALLETGGFRPNYTLNYEEPLVCACTS